MDDIAETVQIKSDEIKEFKKPLFGFLGRRKSITSKNLPTFGRQCKDNNKQNIYQ